MLDECSFETDRLNVGDWQSTYSEHGAGQILVAHITDDARKFLPDSLASIRTTGDSVEWLQQQRAEVTAVLFATLKSSDQVAGVLIASEQSDSGTTLAYIGYLVSPEQRGKGIATELVQGFVNWVEKSTNIDLLIGGVDSLNTASISVLTKSGFEVKKGEADSDGYLMYERRLNR